MPPFSELKSLRVFFLKLPEHLLTMDITGVGQLSQLRYLYINASNSGHSIVLPSEIRRMRHLQRLELHVGIDGFNTPSDIVDLPYLSQLILPFYTSLPDGIGKMKSLRTLKHIGLAESSPENIKGLGELNKLEDLRFDWHNSSGETPTAIWMDALIFSLGKLSNLKRFYLRSHSIAIGADALSLLSPPFRNIEELHLRGLTFSRVPRWIGGLQKLRNLTLGAKQMPQEDIGVIGTLPCLLKLWLRVPGVPTVRIVIGWSTGFKDLEHFEFDCDVVSYLTFEDGAMPSLRVVWLGLHPHEWDKTAPLGLQYLSSLKEISVRTLFYPNDDKIRRVFQEAACAHPSHPEFNLLPGFLRRYAKHITDLLHASAWFCFYLQ